MIDFKNITNFQRSDSELQEFALFCAIVAGKSSGFAATKTESIVRLAAGGLPFDTLRELGPTGVSHTLRQLGVGPYERTTPAILGLLDLDLRTCSLADLLAVSGIGPKTARMFLLHSRPEQEWVVLDVHILRWLRRHRMHRIPRQTPTFMPLYLDIERRAIDRIKRQFPGVTFAEFDLKTWTLMREGQWN